MEERTYLSGTSLAGMSPTRSRVENDYYIPTVKLSLLIWFREMIGSDVVLLAE
jgi:hypothetical protein